LNYARNSGVFAGFSPDIQPLKSHVKSVSSLNVKVKVKPLWDFTFTIYSSHA